METAMQMTSGGAAQVETLDEEIKTTLATADDVTIEDTTDYEMAGEYVVKLKALKKRAEDFIAPFVKDAFDAHKKATARKNALIDPIDAVIRKMQTALSGYQTKAEAQRKLEERMASQMATQEAKEEGHKLADALEAGGDKGTADAIRAQAERTYVPVTAESTVPKVAGLRTRDVWHFEIMEKEKLPVAWMLPNEKAIQKYADSMKDGAQIPGVRFWVTKETR